MVPFPTFELIQKVLPGTAIRQVGDVRGQHGGGTLEEPLRLTLCLHLTYRRKAPWTFRNLSNTVAYTSIKYRSNWVVTRENHCSLMQVNFRITLGMSSKEN